MNGTNKITINGVQLAYTEEGDGKALIFLHAFPLSQAMWRPQAEAMRATHRVITLDWRGFGASELGAAEFSLENLADDLAGLLAGLKIDSATICGLSMGGYVAFAFYKKYAAKVDALILADTKAGADGEEARQGRFELVQKARNQGATAIADAMIPKLLGERSMRTNPNLINQVRQIIEANQPDAIARALLAMAGRADSRELLSKITCPTLILCGSEDKLTPPTETLQMSQAIIGSTSEVIQGAGHLTNLEAPESFNAAVGSFLEQL